MTEYFLNNEKDFEEAMKNSKPGDVFIKKYNKKKYNWVKEPVNEPTIYRFMMEDMIKSKTVSIDIRRDILEYVDTSVLLKTAYENLEKDDYPVSYHRYQIFSLSMDKYDEEIQREDEIMKGKEWKRYNDWKKSVEEKENIE